MYVVRETFTAKPGMASALAKRFKALLPMMPEWKARLLTDVIGDFNTVVLEVEVENLATYERMMADLASREDVREAMKGYTDLYLTGRREIFREV